MDAAKREAIEAAGWKVGDAADFLGMSEEERQLLEMRLELARAIRRQREARKLSQKQLGLILKTSQPRIAKIEQAAPDVSLDQLVRAFTAAGGVMVIKKAKTTKKENLAGRRERLVLELTTPE
ncbi:XRE family transcriptional regulator [Thermopirellula anaerolimosa]